MSTLAYFDVNAKTQVIADASPVGFGAVLVQKQGEDYKIFFFFFLNCKIHQYRIEYNNIITYTIYIIKYN